MRGVLEFSRDGIETETEDAGGEEHGELERGGDGVHAVGHEMEGGEFELMSDLGDEGGVAPEVVRGGDGVLGPAAGEGVVGDHVERVVQARIGELRGEEAGVEEHSVEDEDGGL